jgi:hypothetical protein
MGDGITVLVGSLSALVLVFGPVGAFALVRSRVLWEMIGQCGRG